MNIFTAIVSVLAVSSFLIHAEGQDAKNDVPGQIDCKYRTQLDAADKIKGKIDALDKRVDGNCALEDDILKKKVLVPANKPWTSTGLHLRKGSRITIDASGTVANNPSDAGRDPDGNSAKYRNERRGWNPLPSANDMSLIGRIGDTLFPVSKHCEMAAPCDGMLCLGVNDNNVADNSGAWEAVIACDASTPPSHGNPQPKQPEPRLRDTTNPPEDSGLPKAKLSQILQAHDSYTAEGTRNESKSYPWEDPEITQPFLGFALGDVFVGEAGTRFGKSGFYVWKVERGSDKNTIWISHINRGSPKEENAVCFYATPDTNRIYEWRSSYMLGVRDEKSRKELADTMIRQMTSQYGASLKTDSFLYKYGTRCVSGEIEGTRLVKRKYDYSLRDSKKDGEATERRTDAPPTPLQKQREDAANTTIHKGATP